MCIGAGAWIGSGAVVMADVGCDTIIGAGAVVTRSVPPLLVPFRELFTEGVGVRRCDNAVAALRQSYADDVGDEFVKASVSQQTWWAISTYAMGEVVSADAY